LPSVSVNVMPVASAPLNTPTGPAPEELLEAPELEDGPPEPPEDVAPEPLAELEMPLELPARPLLDPAPDFPLDPALDAPLELPAELPLDPPLDAPLELPAELPLEPPGDGLPELPLELPVPAPELLLAPAPASGTVAPPPPSFVPVVVLEPPLPHALAIPNAIPRAAAAGQFVFIGFLRAVGPGDIALFLQVHVTLPPHGQRVKRPIRDPMPLVLRPDRRAAMPRQLAWPHDLTALPPYSVGTG